MAISFGGTLYPWSSAPIIALFILLPLLLCCFVTQQLLCLFTTPHTRIFPLEFLANPLMLNLFLQVAGATTGVFGPIYLLPLFFSFVKHTSSLTSGVRLLPYVIPMVVLCVTNGYAMGRFGWYAPWFITGAALTLVGSALLATIDTTTSNARVYAYSALAGLGSGCYIQATFAVAQVKAPKKLKKYVLGFLTNAQLAGPAFALSIANAAFLNEAMSSVQSILPGISRQDIQLVIDGAGADIVNALNPGTKAAVTAAIVKALSRAFFVSMTAGALTLVLAFFLKWEKLFVGVPSGAAEGDEME